MWRLLALALAASLSFAGPSRAGGSLSVAPVTLEFRPGARALSTEVSNLGDAAMTVQIRLFAWRTDHEGDHYAPSQDIGFSPPIFLLAPGAKQTVRLALTTEPSPDQEAAYRLYVDQLPSQDAIGVQLPVRLVLPVFVPPARRPARAGAQARPLLNWSAKRMDDGQVVLIAANSGGRRAKLLELAAHDAAGQATSIRSGLAGYVLAGESRGWTFMPPSPGGQLDISARGEEGEIRVAVPISP